MGWHPSRLFQIIVPHYKKSFIKHSSSSFCNPDVNQIYSLIADREAQNIPVNGQANLRTMEVAIVYLTHSAFTIKMCSTVSTATKMPIYPFQISFLEKMPCVWPSREKNSCIGQKQVQGFHTFFLWQHFTLIQTGHNSYCRKLLSVCWHHGMPSLLTRLRKPSMTIQDSVQLPCPSAI